MSERIVGGEFLLKPRSGLKVRRVLDWEAAGLAGLLGAFCMFVLELALMPLAGQGVLAAPRTIADALFGASLPGGGAGRLVAIALFAHLTLGLVWGRAVAGLVFARPEADAVPLGVMFGLSLYVVNFHLIGLALPGLAAAGGWVWVLAHLLFGAVAASAYRRLERLAYE